jgi:predicted Zn-dependent peptidase
VLHPAFKPDELARRREATLASIRADEDDPTAVARGVPAHSTATHRTAIPTGTEETVQRITRGDVQKFAEHYGAERAVVVVGDISAAEAREAFRAGSGGMEGWRCAAVRLSAVRRPPANACIVGR